MEISKKQEKSNAKTCKKNTQYLREDLAVDEGEGVEDHHGDGDERVAHDTTLYIEKPLHRHPQICQKVRYFYGCIVMNRRGVMDGHE